MLRMSIMGGLDDFLFSNKTIKINVSILSIAIPLME